METRNRSQNDVYVGEMDRCPRSGDIFNTNVEKRQEVFLHDPTPCPTSQDPIRSTVNSNPPTTTKQLVESSILAGMPHGVESRELEWHKSTAEDGNPCCVHVGGTQNSSISRTTNTPITVLARDSGDDYEVPFTRRDPPLQGQGGRGTNVEEDEDRPEGGEENSCATLCRHGSPLFTTKSDYPPQVRRDATAVRERIRPDDFSLFFEDTGRRWYSGILSNDYDVPEWDLLDNDCERPNFDTTKWTIHAPKITPTTYQFSNDIGRWLSINEFTTKIFNETLAIKPLNQQVNESTCRVPETFMQTLIDNGIVEHWGDAADPPAQTMFIGNVFLHPEPEKERWRMIFHPRLFNEIVRRFKLVPKARLPHLRQILTSVLSSSWTIKMDLKCAFFQVPIQQGLFCFRYRNKLFTLNRLPMGACMSVLIAQSLSTAFAKSILSSPLLRGPKNHHAYVDDIFLFTASGDEFRSEITKAVEDVCYKFNVSIKTFQIIRVGSGANGLCDGSMAYHRSSHQGTTYQMGGSVAVIGSRPPCHPVVEGSSFDLGKSHPCVAALEELDRVIEVLGVSFQPAQARVSVKEAFKKKATTYLTSVRADLTPKILWKIAGICFHVTYILGMNCAPFIDVFRLLCRVGRMLQGHTKGDPAWKSILETTTSERASVQRLIATVLSFPTVVFQTATRYTHIVFTDSSDVMAGLVVYGNGTLSVRSLPWISPILSLSINSKETIAASIGIRLFSNFGNVPLLVIDSTSALWYIVKGRSLETYANIAIRRIRTTTSLWITWVPTYLMPADLPSRHLNSPHVEVDMLMQLALRSMGKIYFLPCQF